MSIKICKSGLHQFDGCRCKECSVAKTKAWKIANPDKVIALKKKWW